MAKTPKPVTETQQKVGQICEKALAEMQNKVLKHYEKHPDSAWSGHYLVDLEKTIKEVYTDMGINLGKSFKKGLTENMKQFYDKAYKDVQKAGKRNAILGKPDTRLVKNYLESSFEEIAMRTTKMSFEHIRALRSMAGDVLKTSSLTGASMAEVTRDFLARAQEIPGFKFTAANGAQWSNEAYFKMLARTELMNAARASYDQKCAEEGCDLVELDYGGAHCCDACAEYEGKQFSLTGATPGYPTKDDLIEAGVFHPNCTHSYSAVPNWNLPAAEEEPEKKAEEEQPEEKAAPATAQNAEPETEAVKAPATAPVIKPKPEIPPVDAEQADAEKKLQEAEKAQQDAEAEKQKADSLYDEYKKIFEKAKEEAEKAKREAEEAERKAREEEERQKQAAEELRKKTEETKKAEEEARKVAKKKEAGFPEKVEGLRHIDYLGGSTGAELVEDANGNRFVMKRGASADHVRNELAVDNFYRAAGINVPEGKIIETPDGPVKLSRYIDETQSLGKWWNKASKAEREEMKQKLREGFAADVLSGNWDVVGMQRDNILIDKNGNPWRVDNGGGFGFRAQGARKDDKAWNEGWPDDVWTMRTSDYNKELFGDIKTLDLLNSINDRDWKKAIKGLPDDEKIVIEKRLAEIKQLAVRGNDFKDNARYTDNAVETILKSSYDYSKDGLREKVPIEVVAPLGENVPTNFGWFRAHGLTKIADDNQNDNDTIKYAFMNAGNDIKLQGKLSNYSRTKLDDAEKILKKESANGNPRADFYIDELKRVRDADKIGKPVDLNVIHDVYVKTSSNIKDHTSFTGYIYDYISNGSIEYKGKTIPLSPEFIRKGQKSQSDDSYNVSSCKMKIVRLNAEGISTKDAKKTYFTGASSKQKSNWREADRYYKDHPEELARDTETYLRFQSAVCVALENTKFVGNDTNARTVILGRTEEKKVMAKSSVGHEMQAKHGVNESHGIFQTYCYTGHELTVTEVPYSRISGLFFIESEPGKYKTSFRSDSENEFTADTSGLKTLYVKADVSSYENMKDYGYINAYLNWKNAGYPP